MNGMTIHPLVPTDGTGEKKTVGGKAANLALLMNAGLPVPASWVVPAAVLDHHLAMNGLMERVAIVVRHPDEAGCSELRNAIREMAMDDALIKGLVEVETGKWSVRSSAVMEDGSRASYSGLFRTSLGVGNEGLGRAVRDVWASAFDPAALAYHRRITGSHDYPRMAVLLCSMIPADVAGIAFTADPVGGNPFEMSIVACRGLGTRAVGGSVGCDQWSVAWDDFQVIRSRKGVQPSGDFMDDDEGVVERPIPASLQSEQCLSSTTLRGVAELAKAIDRLTGSRVDLEFAVQGSVITVLQAREITALPPWFPDNPESSARRIIRSGEGVVASPFARAIVESPSRHSLPPPPWPLEIAECIFQHGRMFVRLPADSPAEDRSFLRRMSSLAEPREEFRSWMAWGEEAYSRIIPDIRKRAEALLQYERTELGSLDPARLCDLLRGALDLGRDGDALYVSASGPTYECVRRIYILVRDWVTTGKWEEARLMAMALVDGSPKLTHELLRDLERAACGGMAVREICCRWGYTFMSVDDMVDTASWRGWREDESSIQAVLSSAGAEGGSLEERLKRTLDERESRYAHCASAILAGDLREGPRRLAIFSACVEAGRRLFTLKDDRDLVSSHAQAALRWIVVEAARRLHLSGSLAEERDVFLLKPSEILDALENPGRMIMQLKELVDERRLEQEQLMRYRLPSRGSGSAIEAENAGELCGTPAASGIAEGRARVARSVEEARKVQPGEILCLHGDRRLGWVVFFPSIAGLLYESGNWLCHEANLCRELGIPAIVELGGSIRVIQDGQRLRIDGSTGGISLLAS